MSVIPRWMLIFLSAYLSPATVQGLDSFCSPSPRWRMALELEHWEHGAVRWVQCGCDLTHWVSVWKTIEGSWFVLGMFLPLVSLNSCASYMLVEVTEHLREGWKEQ